VSLAFSATVTRLKLQEFYGERGDEGAGEHEAFCAEGHAICCIAAVVININGAKVRQLRMSWPVRDLSAIDDVRNP
jgi:hypothetical protein